MVQPVGTEGLIQSTRCSVCQNGSDERANTVALCKKDLASGVYVCVSVCMCMCVCVYVCVSMCVCVQVNKQASKRKVPREIADGLTTEEQTKAVVDQRGDHRHSLWPRHDNIHCDSVRVSHVGQARSLRCVYICGCSSCWLCFVSLLVLFVLFVLFVR